jgi:hypothetical protein
MDYIAERKRQIAEIEKLWREKTGKGLRELDAAIMKKFETTSGRDALTFESMKTVREGLMKINQKEKN